MAIDASVVAAIETAVAANPDNVSLRVHLVSLLIATDRCNEALTHCTAVLSAQPDNLEALQYAAQAAATIGESAKAEGFRRLYAALSGQALQKSETQLPADTTPREIAAAGDREQIDAAAAEDAPARAKVVPL